MSAEQRAEIGHLIAQIDAVIAATEKQRVRTIEEERAIRELLGWRSCCTLSKSCIYA